MGRLRSLLPWAVGICLLLSACGGAQDEPVQEALDFRVSLLESSACTYSADVTVDYGDRLYTFSMDCTYHPQENSAELTVTDPETIAGIRAEIAGEEAMLQFDDVTLELGSMGDGRLAPMQLPQLLGDAWAYGYVESQARESDSWLVTYRCGYGEDMIMIYTWFDGTMAPLQAEIYLDDVRVLTAELESYCLETAVPDAE